MKGYLDRDTSYPLIDLIVNGHTVTCLIDTGFTGDLALGIDMADTLSLDLSAESSFSKVAGEGRVPTKESSAHVKWFDQSREVGVTVFSSETVGPKDGIIGVHMLIGYILVIDLNEGIVVIKNPAFREVFR